MNSIIRPVVESDIPALKQVVDSCELFPSEFLEEMLANYLNVPDSEEIWFTCSENDTLVGFGYCVPEQLTEGTYNLLAIGVAKNAQRTSIGQKMMGYIEDVLKGKNGRILIVETSSDQAQEGARNFYRKLTYTQMAVIKDFWKDGEDKIVFWKRL